MCFSHSQPAHTIVSPRPSAAFSLKSCRRHFLCAATSRPRVCLSLGASAGGAELRFLFSPKQNSADSEAAVVKIIPLLCKYHHICCITGSKCGVEGAPPRSSASVSAFPCQVADAQDSEHPPRALLPLSTSLLPTLLSLYQSHHTTFSPSLVFPGPTPLLRNLTTLGSISGFCRGLRENVGNKLSCLGANSAKESNGNTQTAFRSPLKTLVRNI